MSPTGIGIIGMALFFLLLVLGMPIALSMIIVGVGGIATIHSLPAALSMLSAETFEIATTLELGVIPLFVFMGNLAGLCGMSRDLYNAAYAWTGHRKGGLAATTIIGCAGFSALSGFAFASAVTMGRVALPEMKRFGYDDGLATGCVAAGGTLGYLIPLSSGFVIYAILTEQSIARLFVAGIVPGILLTLLFLGAIAIQTRIRPRWHLWLHQQGGATLGGPAAEWRFVGIVAVTIGGIYGGVMTPVEAAGVGSGLTLVVCV